MPAIVTSMNGKLLLAIGFAFIATSAHASEVKWGLTIGVGTEIPVGGDVSQDASESSEFAAGFALRAELFTMDVGRWWQFSPIALVVDFGGLDTDTYATALGGSDSLVGEPTATVGHIGPCLRYFPFSSQTWRPFLGGCVNYAFAAARWQTETSAELPGALQGLLPASDHHRRHTGIGFSVSTGIRHDLAVEMAGERRLIPIILELGYQQNVWLSLDEDEERSVDGLAGEDMELNWLGATLSVGILR